jgi:hypothetical protein
VVPRDPARVRRSGRRETPRDDRGPPRFISDSERVSGSRTTRFGPRT